MPSDPFATLRNTLLPGVAERATLWLNHVLRSEPAAIARLVPHAGKRIECRIVGAPSWWPLQPLQFEVTRAGLLELDQRPQGEDADLIVTLDASRPFDTAAGWLAGQRRGLSVAGDAGLAGDVNWLVEHLRWDAADDLERFVGPAAAHGLARAGAHAAAAARALLGALAPPRAR